MALSLNPKLLKRWVLRIDKFVDTHHVCCKTLGLNLLTVGRLDSTCQVYSDLEVAFVMSENETLLNMLAKTGDITYGRTGISSQFYYGCLFHELLSFQLPERHTTEQVLTSLLVLASLL
jgi:hypothetical protein